MQYNKCKIIGCLVISFYLFFTLLSPVLHNHGIDFREHANCPACSWTVIGQVNNANIVMLEFLLLVLFLLPQHKTEIKPLSLATVSSRSPPPASI